MALEELNRDTLSEDVVSLLRNQIFSISSFYDENIHAASLYYSAKIHKKSNRNKAMQLLLEAIIKYDNILPDSSKLREEVRRSYLYLFIDNYLFINNRISSIKLFRSENNEKFNNVSLEICVKPHGSFFYDLLKVMSIFNYKIYRPGMIVVGVFSSFNEEEKVVNFKINNIEMKAHLDKVPTTLFNQFINEDSLDTKVVKEEDGEEEYIIDQHLDINNEKVISNKSGLSDLRILNILHENNGCVLTCKGYEYIFRLINIFLPNAIPKDNWKDRVYMGGSKSQAIIRVSEITKIRLISNQGWFCRELEKISGLRRLILCRNFGFNGVDRKEQNFRNFIKDYWSDLKIREYTDCKALLTADIEILSDKAKLKAFIAHFDINNPRNTTNPMFPGLNLELISDQKYFGIDTILVSEILNDDEPSEDGDFSQYDTLPFSELVH